ncbi:MAG: fibrobacter succinogenes major paralogous domain-containing protein [Dysgonamonadaceae bacterium]|jgi:uncharacterized protein (TIGR02145 family)|nr:fibrobacter succinogenes major paralogous domain-containing protein [Dysgonamonadaceae bacterium]
MKRKMIFLALMLTMLSAASANAQVLIGGSENDEPHSGTVLDLQNTETFKGGLLLPRVALTNLESLDDISGDDKDPEALTGLTVYNTVPCTEGIYTWNGNKWKLVVSTIQDCSSVQDIEGNCYYAARFGAAGCWMTQNLRSTKSSSVTDLIENGNPGEDSSLKYYWYPGSRASVAAATADDILDSHPEYGLLYTWAAVTGRTGVSDNEGQGESNAGNSENIQGICPDGWHLPSDREWNELEKEIANSAEGTYGTGATTAWNESWETINNEPRPSSGNGHGSVMKSATKVLTSTTATNGTSNDLTANGFDALLVGGADHGNFGGYGTGAYFWSISSRSENFAWCRTLRNNLTGVYRYNIYKYYMRSVRCKKNDN